MLDLPATVGINEVGPRDGLQGHGQFVTTATKVAMIDALSRLAFEVIEVTSFAHPDAVPQLRDAEDVLASITRRDGTRYRALVPNARGAARARDSDVDEVLGLVTISEAYNLRNQNRTVAQSLDEAKEAYRIAVDAGKKFTMAFGMSMFCPFEGPIPVERTLAAVGDMVGAGVDSIYLAGSVGMEAPSHVAELISSVRHDWPDVRVGFHIHDFAGFGAANALAALLAGAHFLESSICGLGGGMHTPSGTTNLATEDLVHLLAESGVDTGIGVGEALEVSRRVGDLIGFVPRSRLVTCGVRADVVRAAASAG